MQSDRLFRPPPYRIVLQEQLARLLVQSRLRVRLDKEASYDCEDVRERELWLPVPLKGVDTYLPRLGNVGVENLGQEKPCASARMRAFD